MKPFTSLQSGVLVMGTLWQVGTSPPVDAGPGLGFWVLLALEASPWGCGGSEPPG